MPQCCIVVLVGHRSFLVSLRLQIACLQNSTVGRIAVARPASRFVCEFSEIDKTRFNRTMGHSVKLSRLQKRVANLRQFNSPNANAEYQTTIHANV
jgi:hypothetical protein